MDLEKQWGFEYRPLNSIIPNKKNPRKASKKAVEKLQKQIKEVGFHACIKVDNNGIILGGNTRYKALHNLLNEGYVDLQVPVMYPKFQLTEKEREQIIITDNVNDGEWDFEALMEDFDFEDLEEWDWMTYIYPLITQKMTKKRKKYLKNVNKRCIVVQIAGI